MAIFAEIDARQLAVALSLAGAKKTDADLRTGACERPWQLMESATRLSK